MIHHGDRIAALVDGELDHDTRDRLLSHIAECADCRAAVDEQRWLKAALARSDGPVPSAALLSTLISMAEPGEPTPRTRRPLAPVTPWSERETAAVAAWTNPHGPAGRDGTFAFGRIARHRIGIAAAAAVSASAVTAGLALVGAEPQQQGPALTPPIDSYVQQHAETTGQMFGDPAYPAVFGVGSDGVPRR